MKDKVIRAIGLCMTPEAIPALIRWPVFSWTSYGLVGRLKGLGLAPRTVLDVGANIGQFAVAAGNFFPESRIVCFEPLTACAGALRRNVRDMKNIEVHQIAIGPYSGQVSLYVNRHTHSSSTLRISEAHLRAFPRAEEVGVEEVEIRALDDIFERIDVEPPVLLKVDVQGAEMGVLSGGKEAMGRVDYVVLEASFEPLYHGEGHFRQLLSAMEDCGFGLDRPVGWLADPGTDQILQMDALFRRLRE